MKAKAIVECIGATEKKSKKSGKICYTFVDGQYDVKTNLYINPTCLTFWSDVDLAPKSRQKFHVEIDIMGEKIMVLSATPVGA